MDRSILDFLIPAIAGLVTAALGLITNLLSKRVREVTTEREREAEELAEAVSAVAEERRARILEAIVERLPQDTDPAKFLHALERLSFRAGALESDVLAKKAGVRQEQSWELIEGLVGDYHRQALDQARIQFWFSLAASVFGFGLIFWSIASATENSLDLVLRSLPGVVINAVAALFFKQAGETRQRATALYDRLRSDNQQAKALDLVASIENILVRSTVKAQMALHMAGIATEPVNAGSLIKESLKGGLQSGASAEPSPAPDG